MVFSLQIVFLEALVNHVVERFVASSENVRERENVELNSIKVVQSLEYFLLIIHEIGKNEELLVSLHFWILRWHLSYSISTANHSSSFIQFSTLIVQAKSTAGLQRLSATLAE